MSRTHWHPAFVQAIAIELADYRDVLTFESEHQLTTKPLQIDVLIIKKPKDVFIEKNIGRIFRQYNVVEYKSPTDRATIADYDKTQCYARLYAALNKEDTKSMSVTIVATKYPRKLLRYVQDRYSMERIQPGIYYVFGDTCATQIIVSEELSADDNLWLNSLRNDLTVANLDRLAQHVKQDLPMDAYVYVIGEANIEEMEELMRKPKGVFLSETIDAYFHERITVPAVAKATVLGETRGEARGETRGVALGEARGRIEALLHVLEKKFQKVPRETEKRIRAMTDPVVLDSWIVHAAVCASMKEFTEITK